MFSESRNCRKIMFPGDFPTLARSRVIEWLDVYNERAEPVWLLVPAFAFSPQTFFIHQGLWPPSQANQPGAQIREHVFGIMSSDIFSADVSLRSPDNSLFVWHEKTRFQVKLSQSYFVKFWKQSRWLCQAHMSYRHVPMHDEASIVGSDSGRSWTFLGNFDPVI